MTTVGPSEPDIQLTPDDREDFLVQLARTFSNEAAASHVLFPLAIDRARLPVWSAELTAEAWWLRLFDELDFGIAEQPYRRLLEAALRRYRLNTVFVRLGQRYLPQESEPGTATTCHIIVRADDGDERQQAGQTIAALGLSPHEVWSTEHATSFEVNTSDTALVRQLMTSTNLGWTLVPPGQPDYLVRELYVQGPDGSRFRIVDAPVAQTVRNVSDEIVEHYGPSEGESRMLTFADQMVAGQSTRLDPEGTLADHGIIDGGQLRVGFEARAGGPGPDEFEPSAPLNDHVEWQSDEPTTMDALNRRMLADAISARLLRRVAEDQGAFLILLDGPWGTGKTSVARMVAQRLAERKWTIASYDAWRQVRIGRPWWTLLTTIRQATYRAANPLRRPVRRLAELWQMRVARTPAALAGVIVLAVAAGLFLALRPDRIGLTSMQAGLQTVGAILVSLATVWAGAAVSARFLLWGSARGARFFEQTAENPLAQVTHHLHWLIARNDRPLFLLVDDLDRCKSGDVVEVLESVQTLLRSSSFADPARVRRPVVVLVAADSAWLRTAFHNEYGSLGPVVTEPGQSIGHLFCDKIFQLIVPLPGLSRQHHESFLASLLGSVVTLAGPGQLQHARERLEASGSEAEVLQVLSGMPAATRERLGARAVEALTRVESQSHAGHALAAFAELLPPNPRSMKRFLNDYTMTRAVRTLEGDPVPVAALAQWIALSTRWPAFADYLRAHPDEVMAVPEELPERFRELRRSPAVARTLAFAGGVELTPDLIRRCCGDEDAGPRA